MIRQIGVLSYRTLVFSLALFSFVLREWFDVEARRKLVLGVRSPGMILGPP